jgi:hypothetical protein
MVSFDLESFVQWYYSLIKSFVLQIVYAIWQVEQAPSTRRLHCQAYLRYSCQVPLSTVINYFKDRAHVELSEGNEEQNIAYCSKDESRVLGPFEIGEKAKPGKRKDIDVVRDMVKAGKGMRDIVMVASSYQGMKCAELMQKYMERGRDPATPPEIRWYYGSTGSGKTRSALEEFPDAWVSNRNGQWFDGYDAHEVVVFDDFRKDFCEFHVLLRLLDRYPYRVAIKGGFRQFVARVVIITCPWAPDVLYSNRAQEDIGQLLRRITVPPKLFGSVVPAPSFSVVNGNSASAPHFVSAH